MKHRHLQPRHGTAVEAWPSAAIVDLLERGDLGQWGPLLDAIARDPRGALASRVLRLVDAFPTYGTSSLLRAWIDRRRARAEGTASSPEPVGLPALRRAEGLTQAEVARRTRMSQSDLSKLERRGDVRLSSLRKYLDALGCRLQLAFVRGDVRGEVKIGEERRGRERERRGRGSRSG